MRNTKKMKMYKIVITTIVLCTADTMCITNRDVEKLKVFERKIMRRIPKIDQRDKRIRWYGHINRKKEESVTKQLNGNHKN